MLEKRTRIELRCIAYIAAFGIGYDKLVGITLADILHCLLKGSPTLGSKTLIKSEIGLIGHAIWCGGVNDGLVECRDRIIGVRFKHRRGYLADIGIKPHAEEAALGKNVVDELLAVHYMLR